MLTETQKSQLDKKYVALFTRAKLRTTEVSKILGIHRVTVSRYKNEGIGNCEDLTLKKLLKLIEITNRATAAKDLPLENKDITGKQNRLSALKILLRKHKNPK